MQIEPKMWGGGAGGGGGGGRVGHFGDHDVIK